MKDVAILLEKMKQSRVIAEYALFGATAQMRYTEPVATLDADVLIRLSGNERLDILSEIYRFCAENGYFPEGEAVRIGAWPVQFIPAYDAITDAALENAEIADFEGVPLRVVRADFLAIIALSVGRAKNFTRILALLESGSVNAERIGELSQEHGLSSQWTHFKARFLDE